MTAESFMFHTKGMIVNMFTIWKTNMIFFKGTSVDLFIHYYLGYLTRATVTQWVHQQARG
jgi:hypothetical protein